MKPISIVDTYVSLRQPVRVPDGPKVMVTCPKNGTKIFTGIILDSSSFESAILVNNKLDCYSCGEVHVWSKHDAALEE